MEFLLLIMVAAFVYGCWFIFQVALAILKQAAEDPNFGDKLK